MNMLAAIILNILVGLSAFFAAAAIFKKRKTLEVLLTTFTLALAQIIFVVTLLGVFSKLYYQNVVILHFLIFLFNLWYFMKIKPKLSWQMDLAFIFESNILLLGIALFLGFYCVLFYTNMVNPRPYTDALLYHLPYPVYWMKNGNLINPLVIQEYGNINPNALNALMFYPINAEILFYWLMLPLKNAFLAELGQTPFYIIGIVAIYLILRKFEINRQMALMTSFLWALIPNLIKQIRAGALLDVISAVAFLLVLFYLLELKDGFSFRSSVLFGICLGIFIGVKATAIFWSLCILPLFVFILFKNRANHNLTFNLLTIFLCAIIFGGRTYIRNLIIYHNAFYPVTVAFFGRVIMPGQIDKATFNSLFVPIAEFSFYKLFFSEGLGVQFVMFIAPGTLLPFFYTAFFRKRFKAQSSHVLFFLIPLAMVILYFFAIKAFWVRYLFPYLAVGLMAAVIFLDRFSWGRKYFWLFALIAIFASCAEISKYQELILSLIISLGLFSLFKYHKMFKISKILKSKISALIFLLFLSICLILIEGYYDKNVFRKSPHMFRGKEKKEADTAWAWLWLDENTRPGTRIAYTGRAESYPLFGRRFKNDVFYVSINDRPALPNYYKGGDYRREKDRESWKRNLRESKADYLFVYQPYQKDKFPIEDDWAIQDKKMFVSVYENTRVRIYKILGN